MPLTRTSHKWSERDREVLCLLKRNLRRKYICPVFNHMISPRLKREGFKTGMTAPSLDAQYQEIKGGGKGYEIYTRIDGLSEKALKTQYQDHLQKIDSSIRTLKLKVQPQSKQVQRSTHSNQQNSRQIQRRRAVSAAITETSNASPAPLINPTFGRLQRFAHRSSPYFEILDQMPTREDAFELAHSPQTPTTVEPTLRISTNSRGDPAPNRPLLLFRATSEINHFRSRRYPDAARDVPTPPEIATKDFRDIIQPHLERDKTYPSPFISFAQNPRNAIRRIETGKSEQYDSKMFLAIFALNDIEDNCTDNFGPSSGPHLVRSLYSKHELSDLPDGYNGCGEWVVYGFIDCEPIAVLDATNAIALAKALRRFKHGQVAALPEIGKVLKAVPLKWREAVAFILLRYYCGKALPKKGTPSYRQVMLNVVYGQSAPVEEILELSRLSVEEDDPDYEEDIEKDTPLLPITSGQNTLERRTQARTAPATSTVQPVASRRTNNYVVSELNALAATSPRRPPLQQVQPRRIEQTPLWSPSPEITTSVRTYTDQQQPIVNAVKEVIDLDDSWDLIDDDLENSFAETYPSAARKLQRQTRVPHIEPELESDWEILPSIETPVPPSFEPRLDFLHGIRDHAVTPSTPLIETPTRLVPRRQLIPPQMTSTTRGIAQPEVNTRNIAKPTKSSKPATSHSEDEVQLSPFIDLTTRRPQTFTHNANGNARTNVPTKVPIIVRKRLFHE